PPRPFSSPHRCHSSLYLSFFFNHPPTTEIYTLSLHDALPISNTGSNRLRACPSTAISLPNSVIAKCRSQRIRWRCSYRSQAKRLDRKSTRLNSSHVKISYAVFCLKKKTTQTRTHALLGIQTD